MGESPLHYYFKESLGIGHIIRPEGLEAPVLASEAIYVVSEAQPTTAEKELLKKILGALNMASAFESVHWVTSPDRVQAGAAVTICFAQQALWQNDGQIHWTHSLKEMLADPSYKKQVWQQLQPLKK